MPTPHPHQRACDRLLDSRIAMIYEGTNEIQAIDLLQRKIMTDGGAKLLDLLAALPEITQI